ncbi:cellulose-binding protein [Marinimicrobium sp. C6131]|uniref:glycine cleavage system protein R n=1 Tax=Marinimicrobium sp. C6131 TaxID=3022676 RepID=UPI00223D294D|nr:ACT domain-containing protein [Marinimicrobium sp. C6131]UZJ45914.1 cellulose-binding protein [Marinimicrobium sp. C6131]
MQHYLILTLISDDKPGIVERLAQIIQQHEGNWLESRLSHLAGKFAGIVQVAVPEAQREPLTAALQALGGQGLKLVVESAEATERAPFRAFRFTVAGPDRAGIVFEIAQAFAERNINMGELETDYSSMPWSGEPLFQANGVIEVPESVDMNELHDDLDSIADQLAIDIRLEEDQP